MIPKPSSTSSKLLGVTKNDYILESVRHSPQSRYDLRPDLAAAVDPQGPAQRTDGRDGRPLLRRDRGVRQPAAEMVVHAVRRHHHFCPGLSGAVPGPGQLERSAAGLQLSGYREADRVRQRPDRLDRRPRVGKGNGPFGRSLRSDFRQVRGDADRRSRQGSASTEDGRPSVRLQLLGVPRIRRQGRLRLSQPDRRRLALGR